MGYRRGAARGVQGEGRCRDLHPGVGCGHPAERARVVAGAADRRPGGHSRRDRRLRHEPAVSGGHRRRPAVQPRAHLGVQHHRRSLGRRREHRPADLAGPGAATPHAQARRVRNRRVLRAEGPTGVRHETQRRARRPRVRQLDHGPTDRYRRDAAHPRRPTPVRHRDHRASVRRGPAERHVLGPEQVRHLDAPAERDHRPTRPALHGRGRGLPAADRHAADEEADHAADEAGPGVRRRGRAEHTESGRRRLQGDQQCRYMDDRAADDRAGQGAAAGRDDQHRGGHRRGVQRDLRVG